MWELPVYKINKRIGANGRSKHEEIVIDVTGSAPPMQEPGGALESVFALLTRKLKPTKTRILDIGAAKLRNTLYLLKKGLQVYAVEFEQLAQRMPQARDNWEKARSFSNFKRLIFPVDFFKLKDAIDIALMINVTNVMPIPDERLALLSVARQKMKKNGLLLWYNWRDISSNPDKYTENTSINDGYFKGAGREFKTFHGEWDRAHVFEMLISSGFSHAEEIELPEVSSNQAYVFRANGPILLDKYLGLEEIMRGGKKRDPGKVLPEEEKTYFPGVYVRELKETRSGKSEQAKFHRLAARLVANIFDHQLKKPVIEHEINEGRGRIDIKFQNQNKPGFFKNAKEMRKIMCPAVFVECKNYQDLDNPEFDQLAGRLDPLRGQLGLLVSRKGGNRERSIKHCRDRVVRKNQYIVPLDDKDLEALSELKLKSNEDVDDYMEERLEEIID